MADLNPKRFIPGVYINELDAFPPSIVGVQTAVPVFIGYTQKAMLEGKSAYLTPVAIQSMADFEAVFGGGFKPLFNIVEVDSASPAPSDQQSEWDAQVGSAYFKFELTCKARFYLYLSMRLFFANGGGQCYVVSVGDYTAGGQQPGGVAVQEADLLKGIAATQSQVGPTILVVPDAMSLPDIGSYAKVAQELLAQCGSLQDRVAILDVYDAGRVSQNNMAVTLEPVISAFQNSVGSDSLGYGMAYFPLLHTAAVQPDEVDYTNFNLAQSAGGSGVAGMSMLQSLLQQVADLSYPAGSPARKSVQQYIDAVTTIVENPAKPEDPAVREQIQKLNQNLNSLLPTYQQWQSILLQKLNLLPPGGAMAGIFTTTDATRGVWSAPANMQLNAVVSCAVKLNDAEQSELNIPLNGKAVNAIRDFVGRGPVVWGARTLDENSSDWRYIQVRRTIIYIEQSIKNALKPFVFAVNDVQTWATVSFMISDFLTELWAQGALLGDIASEAYTVDCGLGNTMTAQDILDGYMIVQVKLQMIRPAEFIELTFKQKMQSA